LAYNHIDGILICVERHFYGVAIYPRKLHQSLRITETACMMKHISDRYDMNVIGQLRENLCYPIVQREHRPYLLIHCEDMPETRGDFVD